MSLKEISSLVSARRKFFMNSTYIMSKSVGIKRFFAQEAKMCQTPISNRREENFSSRRDNV